jgi:hypothetical protein
MAEKPFSTLFDLFASSASIAGRTELRASAESFWEAQKAILADMEALNRAWFDRRRRGAEAARGAACEMCACGDAASAIGAYQRWLAGSMGRIAADAMDAQMLLAKTAQTYLNAVQTTALSSIPAATTVPAPPAKAEPAPKRAAA